MRNVDRIKRLETELGRYQKKVGDQQAELQELRKKLEGHETGAAQVNTLVDAVLAAVAVKYGTAVQDEGEALGYRLELDDFAVDRLLDAWEVHAQKRDGVYVVGVMPREK